jgi:hypothetical protein
VGDVLPLISNTKGVADFNEQFSLARRKNGFRDPTDMRATWWA